MATPTDASDPATRPSVTPTDASDPAWVTADVRARLAALDCARHAAPSGPEQRDRPLVTCADNGSEAYVLGPAELDATDVASVSYGPLTNAAGMVTGTRWQVDLQLTTSGTARLATLTTRLSQYGAQGESPRDQLAMVVDSVVVTAPSVREPIRGGKLQITGNFDEAAVRTLVARIKGSG